MSLHEETALRNATLILYFSIRPSHIASFKCPQQQAKSQDNCRVLTAYQDAETLCQARKTLQFCFSWGLFHCLSKEHLLTAFAAKPRFLGNQTYHADSFLFTVKRNRCRQRYTKRRKGKVDIALSTGWDVSVTAPTLAELIIGCRQIRNRMTDKKNPPESPTMGGRGDGVGEGGGAGDGRAHACLSSSPSSLSSSSSLPCSDGAGVDVREALGEGGSDMGLG